MLLQEEHNHDMPAGWQHRGNWLPDPFLQARRSLYRPASLLEHVSRLSLLATTSAGMLPVRRRRATSRRCRARGWVVRGPVTRKEVCRLRTCAVVVARHRFSQLHTLSRLDCMLPWLWLLRRIVWETIAQAGLAKAF